MADVKISQLPAVVTVSPQTDVTALVSGGATTKATPTQIVSAALNSTSDVNINPTAGGSVFIAPNTTGAINNMTIGATTRAAGNFTNVGVKGTMTVINNGATGDPQMTIATNDAADAIIIIPSVIGSPNSGTLIIDVGDSTVSSWTFSNGDFFPSQGSSSMVRGFSFVPGAAAAPSGTPATTNAGIFPMYVNSTPGSERLHVYVNGAWKSAALT